MINHLTEEVKITIAVTTTLGASAATVINGAIIDMQGWDGVLFVVPFGPITAGAVTSIKAQQDTDPAMGAAADLLGSGQTVADSDDDKCFVIDLKRPLERYVRCVVSRATQVATVGSVLAIQYRPRIKGLAQGANVAVERWISLAEGTA